MGGDSGRLGVDLDHVSSDTQARLELKKDRWLPPSETNKQEVLSESA
jgi:hypothetical protein